MVENEEANASVIVKMTDSFTEQADQVILKGPSLWQERLSGGSQAVRFVCQFQNAPEENVEKVKNKTKSKNKDKF